MADSNSSTPRITQGQRGMVTSVSGPASDAGLAVLKQGGNAVDAAVATALALSVTYPQAGNLGGGGFMLVHRPDGKPQCVDYRETAPAAATEDMFELGASRLDHRMVGVPGTVAGLALAVENYGTKKWADLVAPAVKLAAEGFALDPAMAGAVNDLLATSDNQELQRVFTKPGGGDWADGDTLVQKDLAATLTRLAKHGPAEFYEGKTANLLIAEMKAGQGLISLRDLADYRAKLKPTVSTTFRGFDIHGPALPSSGGIVLCQMLNMLETFDLKSQGRYSVATLHQMIETMKRAYRDRARHLGDDGFVDVPNFLTEKSYAAKLAEQITPDKATPSHELAEDIKIVGEGDSTTHFSVIDHTGLAVSNTYTLEQTWGARIMVRGAGFLLNNEMGDFNWKKGHTDRVGRIGTEANLIAPGKRMLSSQTPTIVTKSGKPYLITGSPGGRTIINTVLCMVLNICEFEMNLRAAVDAPRLHHSWLPDVAYFEGLPVADQKQTLAQLNKLGHRTISGQTQGNAHSILIAGDTYHGVADARRYNGKAAGW